MTTPQQDAFQRLVDEYFPETLPAEQNTVATYIHDRSPAFKVHSKVGLAHNALGGRGFTVARAKYELVSGEWKRVWAYVPPDNCRRCGRKYDDVVAEEQRQRDAKRGSYWRVVKYHHDPTYTGPKWSEEPVCRICVGQIEAEQAAAQYTAGAGMVLGSN